MSIAQGTIHYDYPQVQLTDRPTFADFNPAFADIDAKLYSLVSDSSTMDTRVDTLEASMTTAQSDIGGLRTDVNSANAGVATNAEAITALQATVGGHTATLKTKLDSAAVADPYDSEHGTYSVGDIVTYNGQRYKCITAVTAAEPFDADKWQGEDVQTVLDRIGSDLVKQSMNDRKIVLFSDSYGTSDSNGGWCSKVKSIVESMGTNTVDYRATSGYGFVGHDGTFLSLITTYANAQTSEARESITDIVIAAGWNDNDSSDTTIVGAVESCINYCKATFPNATIWVGNIAVDKAYQTGLNILRKVQRTYEKGCNNTGAKFMSNVLYASWDFNNLADTRHPTDAGYENIAYAIINTLINGSCEVIKDYIALNISYGTDVTGPSAFQSMFNRIVTTYFSGGFINNTGTAYGMRFDDNHAVKVADVSGGCFCGDPLGTSGVTVPMVFSVDVSGTVGLHYGSGKIFISDGGLYIKPFFLEGVGSSSTFNVDKIYFQTSQITNTLGISC